MKKVISYLIIVIMTTLFFTGCKSEGSSSKKNVKILFSYTKEVNNEFRDILAENAISYAKSVGSEVVIEEAEGSIEKQVDQFKNAKNNGYSAIICIPEDVDIAKQLMAEAGDLPIIFVNKSPDEDVLVEDKYIYVGSNEEIAGQYQAEYILEKLSSQDSINIALLKGEKGHSATIGRTNKFIETLNNSGKNIDIVFNDYADFSLDVAKTSFNVLLSTGKKVDAVACNNDSMAMGVIEACKDNDIDPSSIMILGVDATNDGRNAIINGDMAFTVSQPGDVQGEYAARAAIELATNGTVKNIDYAAEDLKHVWVPFEKVDKSNVKN
ncbi:MAG: sugar ABC transporter substrate-binding protein [Clostridium butyricum]|nr:sugar ABC transporter substrate-binding protein [Clostridium butyricum]